MQHFAEIIEQYKRFAENIQISLKYIRIKVSGLKFWHQC